MYRYCELIGVFLFLFAGFLMLVWRTECLGIIKQSLLKAKISVEEQDRQAKLQRRNNLMEFQKKNTLWLFVENQIEFTGLRRLINGISAGKVLVINLILTALFFWIGSLMGGIKAGLVAIISFFVLEIVAVQIAKTINHRRVNEELPKFLDFLGNYSLSSGELISIFSQISRYLENPIRGVLEECEAESKISGNSTLAILAMADKIEHPQFRQLVRNIEITSRYSADFNALVTDSRRSMREYISQNHERRGMLREAGINMGLLLVMSVIVLFIVNILIEGSVWGILFGTFVGHIALGGMILIFIMFGFQIFGINK